MDPDALHTFVRDRVAAKADAGQAVQMQRYLKTSMPMFGARHPVLKPIFREAIQRFVPEDGDAWEAGVRTLWVGPERELKYAAIAYGRAFKRRRFHTPDRVSLYQDLVRSGAWWDLVDDIAVNLVGEAVRHHREAMRPVLQRFIDDEDVWIRRTAVLAQLKHKEQTDTAMLLDFCRRRAHEKSFWMRKAIGWALRQHARTDATLVRSFLAEMSETLSGLSRREASKHLPATE